MGMPSGFTFFSAGAEKGAKAPLDQAIIRTVIDNPPEEKIVVPEVKKEAVQEGTEPSIISLRRSRQQSLSARSGVQGVIARTLLTRSDGSLQAQPQANPDEKANQPRLKSGGR
jgi:hypothetical protein